MAETLMQQGAIRSGKRGRPRRRPCRLVADNAYGLRHFKRFLRQRGIQPVIPRKRNQKRGRPHNAVLYRQRNIIERFFCRLNEALSSSGNLLRQAGNHLSGYDTAGFYRPVFIVCRHTLNWSGSMEGEWEFNRIRLL